MRYRLVRVGTLAAIIVASALVSVAILRRERGTPSGDRELQPQCGHWSILRCCQLLGTPTDLRGIVERMPPERRGHSMLQIAAALRALSLEAEGSRQTWETLADAGFPCIVHLTEPDHFIVISGIEGDLVHVFDGSGRRTTRSKTAFLQRWVGEVLFVRRPASPQRLPTSRPEPKAPGPLIRFKCLLVDKGTVPAVGEPVAFIYPFRNLGSTDLVVKKVDVECKCLGTEYPKEPIPPGGEGTVKLSYHVEPRKGPFSHNAVVETNDPQFPRILLTASGFTGVEVKIDPPRLDLGDVIIGREKTATCFLRYTGDWPSFGVEIETSSLEGAQLVRHTCSVVDEELARRLMPDTPADVRISRDTRILELTFRATGMASEKIKGDVSVRTNVSGYAQFTLPVRGQIRLPVRAYPSILDFGEVRPDERLQRTVTLLGLDKEELQVIGVDTESSEMRGVFTPLAGRGHVEVTLKTTGAAALACAGKTATIRVRLPRSGEEVELPLRIAAWPCGDRDK